MKNEKKIDNTAEASSVAAPVKTAHPYRTRFVALIVALSLLVLGAATLILFTFVDFSKDGQTGANQNTGYAYNETNIQDYIPLTKNMVTGLVIPGADSKLDDVTNEGIKTSINLQLLQAAAVKEEEKSAGQYTVSKTLPVGYADELRLHVLYVTDAAGERVEDNDYFRTAYMTANFFQVGREIYGKEFDDKLIGLIPKDTGLYEVRTYGTVDEDDVICLTYTVSEKIPATTADGKETTKTHKNLTAERIELARADKAWRDLLLSNYGTVGQSFSFDYEEDINDDGKTEKVTYNCVVSSVLTEEEPYALTAKLPEDFFTEGYAEEELVALNGKELTFYINIEFLIDHEANTWETMDLTDMINTLGFTPTDKTDLSAARAECIVEMTKRAKEDNAANEPTLKLGLIWTHLLDNLKFTGTLPKEALDEVIASAKQQVESAYNSLYSSDELFAEVFPNIDLYAASSYMWSYDATEYDGYEDFIERYYAPRTVKQALLVYGIYDVCINDEKALEAEFDALITEIIAANTNENGTVTREEILEYYGETYLREQTLAQMVNDYLLANNTVDFTKKK